jgi:DNA-binding protein HU-beta
MTKMQLYRLVAHRLGISQIMALDVCEVFLESIVEALAAGEKVKLAGFGTFRTSTWGGYISKQSGKEVPIRHVCKFTAGKGMKEAAAIAGERD